MKGHKIHLLMPGDHYSDFIKKEVEKSEKLSAIYTETKRMLQTEERFVNFFKSYHPKSIEMFIEYYAQQKAYWHMNADSFLQYREGKNKHYWYLAVGSFRQIYLKKLFDVKCRWVAGEMDLPGIETSPDFYDLMSNPAACQIIEPISAEELNCYMEFLQSGSITEDDDDDYDRGNAIMALGHYHWHKSISLDELTDEDDNHYISPWFRFYDNRFGTGTLLKLPLTRMDIETDYHDTWSEEIFSKTLSPEALKTWSHLNRKQRMELRNNAEKRKAHYEERNRKYEEAEKNRPKYIHIHTCERKIMDELVPKLETPEVVKYYRASVRKKEKWNRNEMIESDLIYMRDVKEWIPVRSNEDYRVAIKEAYKEYCSKKILDMLPVVFEEYTKSLKSGKPFDWSTSNTDTPDDPRDNEMKKRLLAAPKWKGEPENFDFLKKENLSMYKL